MQACRIIFRQLLQATAYAVVLWGGVGFADESAIAIRLPAWIDPSEPSVAVPASYDSAPRPRLTTPSYERPTAVEPPPREPRRLATTATQSDDRLILQLENIASAARTSHALGRLLQRYAETRQKLEATGDKDRLARADRLGGWAYESRGRQRLATSDHAGATSDFRQALRLDDDNKGARHALAVALAESGQADEALVEFSRLIRKHPSSIAARRNRAQLHLGREQPDAAIADVDAALRQPTIPPGEHAGLLRLRGVALHRAGRLRAAANDLNEAIRIDPRNAMAYTARGHVFAEGGFYDQAISDYSAALSNDPLETEAYRSLAWVLATCPEARLRDPQTAVEAAWRARRLLGFDDFLTLDAAAAAHAAAGDFAEAVRLQQRALVSADVAPSDARARLGLYRAGQPYVSR